MKNIKSNIYIDINSRFIEKNIINYMYIIFAFCLHYLVSPVVGDEITHKKLNFFKYFGTGTLPIIISIIVFINL